jgi:hypothetical protein
VPGIVVVSDWSFKLLKSGCLPSCRVFQNISGPRMPLGWLAVSGALKAPAPSDSPGLRVATSNELSLKFVEKQMQVLRLRLAEESAKLRSE